VGTMPLCYSREALGSGGILVLVAALTAATAGAYGASRARDIVDGNVAAVPSSELPVKLSMGGVWQDQSDSGVYLIEPSGVQGARRHLKLLSRKLLRLVFDMPLSDEEAQLAMSEVRSGSCWTWQFYADNTPVLFSSIGCAESACEKWWRGHMLWSAGTGTTLERVSQHRIVLQLPQTRPRILCRMKVHLKKFWNYVFPAVASALALCSLLVDGSLLSILTYMVAVLVHLRAFWINRYQCFVPAAVPKIGSVSMLLIIALFKVWHGNEISTQLDKAIAASCLACLFFISTDGYGCVAGGVSVFSLALCTACLALMLAALEVRFFIALLEKRLASDLAALSCIAAGVLQIIATKIWSNQLDIRFIADSGTIELQEASQPSGSATTDKSDPVAPTNLSPSSQPLQD